MLMVVGVPGNKKIGENDVEKDNKCAEKTFCRLFKN